VEATLLVELLTEELPPKSLKTLSEVFASTLSADLQKSGFLADRSKTDAFATPRRLAVLISGTKERSPDSERDVQGPPVTAVAQAVSGFAKKNGIAVEALKKQQGPKGEIYVAHVSVKGQALGEVLPGKVETALKALPIPKIMRWGSGEAQFVRPVHGLVMMHGSKIVAGSVLGLQSGNKTHGHRFMSSGEIVLANADEYEQKLLAANVVADFSKRKVEIEKLLQAEAKKKNASLGEYQALLDEVAALVEHPSVYVGEFDKAFLEVPQECLILTMRQNQKYFPLFDAKGQLTGKFLIVSNMKIADPRHLIGGNQRVVRPRLEDARFFYNQDRKQRLEDRISLLAKVVYHNKLGSQLDRVQRVKLLAGKIARALGADALQAERAAELAKADLLTGMVGEFPELQGIMGRYYALHDKEPVAVADAIEAHYRPRFAGDRLPEGPIACAVALADKLDALVSIFSVGGAPTGEKDPYGLRRAALGIARILVEARLPLELPKLISDAAETFGKGKIPEKIRADVYDFVLERLRSYLRDKSFSTNEIEAVLSQNPERVDLVLDRVNAVKVFGALSEAKSLAAANKRIRNLLKNAPPTDGNAIKQRNWESPEEAALFNALNTLGPEIVGHFARLEYKEALLTLARFKTPVDNFFDKVLVLADDPSLRNSRLDLLRSLEGFMNQVADISKLAIEK